MTSPDFIKLMNLIYKKYYKIISYHVLYNHEEGETVTIILQKNDDVIKIESKEEDFCDWGASLKNVYNNKGEPELAPLKDGTSYYKELDYLIDEDNTKLNKAWINLLKREVIIDFNINENINKLLLHKYHKKDENIIKLKKYYWEILAFKMHEAKEYMKLKQNLKDKLFEEYHEIINNELIGILEKEDNYIQFYRKINDIFTFNFTELANQTFEEYRYVTDMSKKLTKNGPLDSVNGAHFILDSYRRLVEVGKEMFMTLYYLIEYNKGELNFIKMDYPTLISKLKKLDDIKRIVEFIDPYIRNSESHCSTKLIVDKGNKVIKIRIIDNRNKRSKILNEYTLYEIVNMFNKVKNATLPAIMFSIGMIIIAMELVLLRSGGPTSTPA